jgi:hypothetical protein
MTRLEQTFELTTSAIHAKVFPTHWDKSPNPLQTDGVANTFNYALINSHVEDQHLIAHVRAFGPGNMLLFERDLSASRKP